MITQSTLTDVSFDDLDADPWDRSQSLRAVPSEPEGPSLLTEDHQDALETPEIQISDPPQAPSSTTIVSLEEEHDNGEARRQHQESEKSRPPRKPKPPAKRKIKKLKNPCKKMQCPICKTFHTRLALHQK